MDAQNERLGWLNRHAPQILTGPTVSPHSRDQNVGKLRAINLKWSKVPTHPSYLASLLSSAFLFTVTLVLYSTR